MLDENIYYTNLEYIIYNGSYMYTQNIKYVYIYTHTLHDVTSHDMTLHTYIYIHIYTYIYTYSIYQDI